MHTESGPRSIASKASNLPELAAFEVYPRHFDDRDRPISVHIMLSSGAGRLHGDRVASGRRIVNIEEVVRGADSSGIVIQKVGGTHSAG